MSGGEGTCRVAAIEDLYVRNVLSGRGFTDVDRETPQADRVAQLSAENLRRLAGWLRDDLARGAGSLLLNGEQRGGNEEEEPLTSEQICANIATSIALIVGERVGGGEDLGFAAHLAAFGEPSEPEGCSGDSVDQRTLVTTRLQQLHIDGVSSLNTAYNLFNAAAAMERDGRRTTIMESAVASMETFASSVLKEEQMMVIMREAGIAGIKESVREALEQIGVGHIAADWDPVLDALVCGFGLSAAGLYSSEGESFRSLANTESVLYSREDQQETRQAIQTLASDSSRITTTLDLRGEHALIVRVDAEYPERGGFLILRRRDEGWDTESEHVAEIARSIAKRRELLHIAEHFPGTSIHNEDYLLARLRQAQARGETGQVVVINVPQINEVLNGVPESSNRNELLASIARYWQQLSGAEVAYLGGTAFAIYLSGDQAETSAKIFFNAFLQEPLAYNGSSATAGIARAGLTPLEAGTDVTELLHRASLAALSAPGNTIIPYDEAHRTAMQKKLRRAQDFIRVLTTRAGFYILIEPITASDGSISYEAFFRWHDEYDHERTSIRDILSLAKELGKELYLDMAILGQVCTIVRTLKDELGKTGQSPQENGKPFSEVLGLSVNLMAGTICDPRFQSTITGLLERYGLSFQDIKWELTSINTITDPVQVQQYLDNLFWLKEKGAEIMVDDSGVEIADQDLLTVLDEAANRGTDNPFTALKIDKKFILDIKIDPNAQDRANQHRISVVKHLMRTGMVQGFDYVVVEGVETEELETFIQQLADEVRQEVLGEEIMKTYDQLLPLVEYLNSQSPEDPMTNLWESADASLRAVLFKARLLQEGGISRLKQQATDTDSTTVTLLDNLEEKMAKIQKYDIRIQGWRNNQWAAPLMLRFAEDLTLQRLFPDGDARAALLEQLNQAAIPSRTLETQP